jgi:hypothetical protein
VAGLVYGEVDVVEQQVRAGLANVRRHVPRGEQRERRARGVQIAQPSRYQKSILCQSPDVSPGE